MAENNRLQKSETTLDAAKMLEQIRRAKGQILLVEDYLIDWQEQESRKRNATPTKVQSK